ncbi:hypothetical protein [Actinokineospora globicatena]|uniref:hypothetical protein n=1 Tax=Actinokineospora globicatena TaxID=103729 RepID=UPI0020A38C66|nr:hypothetical protein [Actinokineospora globicatena]MCP2305333.1 hypothetical protein [Actinokineospora globicatena]GLW80810.1 hypothetical protein Aglo01_52910 [Actinokineospora globicatena]GLW87637.1 hypothetical protein Aglo02_52760 [Actinokineospora globicatena]
MSGWLGRFLGGVPKGFTGTLEREEAVVASAPVRDGGHLVATSLGLWVPTDDGPRRIGWHLVSKASWASGVFVITEADEVERAGDAVVLADRAPQRYVVEQPGKLPQAVHRRVTGSIRTRHRRELPDGGAWFVQRKVPGRDGTVLQVRPDPGTDVALVRDIAQEVAQRMGEGLADA